MTLTIVNTLLNALTLVLVSCYGIWLKKIVEQQLKAKDASIENQGTIIKMHEAAIAHLKEEATPAIVDSYQKVRKFADEMAATNTKLTSQIDEAKNTKVSGEKPGLDLLLAERKGFLAASKIFSDAIQSVTTLGSQAKLITAKDLLLVLQTIGNGMSEWTNANLEKSKTFRQLGKT